MKVIAQQDIFLVNAFDKYAAGINVESPCRSAAKQGSCHALFVVLSFVEAATSRAFRAWKHFTAGSLLSFYIDLSSM